MESFGYREVAPPPRWRGPVACLWWQRVAPVGGDRVQLVVPDGCVDIMWSRWAGRLWAAGPDTGPHEHRLPAGEVVFGVRWRPGVGPGVLGVDGADLRDAQPDLEALWSGDAVRLREELAQGADPWALVLAAARRRVAVEGLVDPAMAAVVSAARSGSGTGELARVAGFSERQFRRRCSRVFGYGPATLRRILRFDRALGLSRSGGLSLAEVAVRTGYADQAHLAREVRDLAGVPLGVLR